MSHFLPSFLPSESRPERAGVHELRQDHPRAGRPPGVLRRHGRRAQLVHQDLRVHLAPRIIIGLARLHLGWSWLGLGLVTAWSWLDLGLILGDTRKTVYILTWCLHCANRWTCQRRPLMSDFCQQWPPSEYYDLHNVCLAKFSQLFMPMLLKFVKRSCAVYWAWKKEHILQLIFGVFDVKLVDMTLDALKIRCWFFPFFQAQVV